MQHPEGLHEMKEELEKELKAKLTVPTDVRALLSMSVHKCGEIKLRSFAAELLLVHYGEENMSAICYISCDCHMTSFSIDWSIEKVLEHTHAHTHTHTHTHTTSLCSHINCMCNLHFNVHCLILYLLLQL